MGASASKENKAKVAELVAMGFAKQPAVTALEASGGDVVQAAEMLLSQPPPASTPAPAPAARTEYNSLTGGGAGGGGGGAPTAPQARDLAAREQARNDDALRMALEQSMQGSTAASARVPPSPVVPVPAHAHQQARSEEDMLAEAIRLSLQLSPMERSGHGGGAQQPSPSQQQLPSASRVVTGEVEPLARQLEQHVATLSTHPTTVDTLVAVLQMILDHPDDPQFRRLRLSNRKFRATVAGAPGGIEFLLALGFVRDTAQGVEALVLRRNDPGVLWLGKSTLEQARDAPAYLAAKAVLERQQAAAQVLRAHKL